MNVGAARVSVEQFDAIAVQPENSDRRLEYIGGEIVEVVSNNYASTVASKVNYFIHAYLIEQSYEGYVTSADGGYQVSGERYIPDVGFISRARQPEPCHEAYNPNPPELAVEVLSPSDQPDLLRLKLVNYLAAGTVVWVVNPDSRIVEVYTPGRKGYRLVAGDTLDGGDVLPGFSVVVRDIFPD
jgi:Uma2 family endonuclease